MGKKLTQQEIEKRFEKINALEPEEATESEIASLKAAEEMDDGSVVSLEELKEHLEGYNGRVLLRIPRSLHKTLKEEAEVEGVSLNQYMLYKLAK